MNDLRNILQLLLTDPMKAADEMDRLADELRQKAADVRAQNENPYRSPGGMTDRVRINVVGPDGEVKQRTDTGA